MCHLLCISVLLLFSSRKVFIFQIDLVLWFICSGQFPVLALLYYNCLLTFKLRSYFAFFQKLSLEVFCKKGYCWRFCRFHREIPVLQSLFNKAVALSACSFIERWLQHGCLSCVIGKIFESFYFEGFSKSWHITRLVFVFSFLYNLYLLKLCYQSNSL